MSTGPYGRGRERSDACRMLAGCLPDASQMPLPLETLTRLSLT